MATWQAWTSKSYLARREEAITPVGVAPRTWYDPGNYDNVAGPVVPDNAERHVVLDPSRERDGHFSQTVDLPQGSSPIITNIAAGNNPNDISGVVPLGHNTGAPQACCNCPPPWM